MKRVIVGLFLAFLSAMAFGTTPSSVSLLNTAGSTAGQAILSSGPTSTAAWASIVDSVIAGSGIAVSGATGNVTVSVATNGVALGQLAQQAANTVIANATGSTANLTAFSMPSCSESGSNLQWTSGTGFTCATGYAVTGNPLSQFAATTSAQLAGVISDETGTGLVVLGTGPTINQPNIVGVTSNTAAAIGSVGETRSNSTAAASIANATSANVTSISLPAGIWAVQGMASVVPAGQLQSMTVGVSTVSITLGAFGTRTIVSPTSAAATGFSDEFSSPVVILPLATTTTVYAVVNCTFTSTATAAGFITATRIH